MQDYANSCYVRGSIHKIERTHLHIKVPHFTFPHFYILYMHGLQTQQECFCNIGLHVKCNFLDKLVSNQCVQFCATHLNAQVILCLTKFFLQLYYVQQHSFNYVLFGFIHLALVQLFPFCTDGHRHTILFLCTQQYNMAVQLANHFSARKLYTNLFTIKFKLSVLVVCNRQLVMSQLVCCDICWLFR